MDIADDRLRALKAERDRYVSLSFCWADVLMEIGPDLTVRFATGACEPFLGRSAKALLGVHARDLVAPADGPLLSEMLKRARDQGRIAEELIRVSSPLGMFPVSVAGYCLDSVNGNVFIGMRKATAEAKAHARTVPKGEAGMHDSQGFSELVANRLKSLEEAGETAKVTLVSIPGMDQLERRLTDEQKEKLTQSMGACLMANSIGGDSVTKVGDGRFGFVHSEAANVDDIMGQLEDLTRKLDPTGEGVKAETASIDVPGDGPSVSEEDLAKGLLVTLNRFRNAEGQGFSIKALAANMNTLVGEAVTEVNNFKAVVASGEFYVALQPIIQAHTGEVHHYEALCRFDAKPGESPFKTINFAEETGLIHDFDLAMVEKVVEWLGQFPRNTDRYKIAVNVSGHSISQKSYLDGLYALLKENLWTQGKLMFEITESSRMSDLEEANNFIQGLRKWGYHVCLDDFGAGAASFQYLSALEVDVVKLDGSAVKNSMKAPKGRAFMSALTELCRRMRVETIAEMIDDEPTLHFVRDCGCEYVQGWLFGKPSKNIKDFTPYPNAGMFKPAKRA